MIIGVPSETKAQENRVGMVPGSVAELVKRGHRVLVETGAGKGASYEDIQYLNVVAEIVADAAAVFAGAELIVKVKEPLPPEVAMLRTHHILFTYLHLAANKMLNNVTQPWIQLIADKGVAAACTTRPELLGGINTLAGNVTCKPVAEAHGLTHANPALLLGL